MIISICLTDFLSIFAKREWIKKMKVSKAEASTNRDSIIRAAAAHIRDRGFGQMCVADVTRSAGLTHGALYSHFPSKEALATEGIKQAFDECIAQYNGLALSELLRRYLSTEHRDNSEEGCPTAALASEVPRQPVQTQVAFYEGVNRTIALLVEGLKASGAKHDRDHAIFMFAAMVGGIAISRAIRDVDGAASTGVLRAVSRQLRRFIK
jgi:TetR/AcrR family transcriptional repressor of nem operon